MVLSHAKGAVGIALLASILAGCGGGGPDGRAVIRGKLVDGSKPFVLDQTKLKLPPGATSLPPGARPLAVVFTPAEGGETANAVVNLESGTFEVPGGDGKGIKPGRYKIAVTATAGGPDYFNGKFAADKTQIIREVKPEEEVVIDVSKPQG